MKKRKLWIVMISSAVFLTTATITSTIALTSCATDEGPRNQTFDSSITQTFINQTGATSGHVQNTGGAAKITFSTNPTTNNKLIIVSPEHTNDSFFRLVLPNNYTKGMFENDSNWGLQSNDKITYELETKNTNWNFEYKENDTSDPSLPEKPEVKIGTTLKNVNSIDNNEILTVKGKITGKNVVNFKFDVKFVRTLEVSSSFTFDAKAKNDNSSILNNATVTNNGHNTVTVTSVNAPESLFEITLPTTVKTTDYNGINSTLFPNGSSIKYKPVTESNENKLSISEDGIIKNNNPIKSPYSIEVEGTITSKADPLKTVDINFILTVQPSVSTDIFTINTSLVVGADSTSIAELSTTKFTSAAVASQTRDELTITPQNASDKFFRVFLSKELKNGMISGLDPKRFPEGSRINYGPIWSESGDILTSGVPVQMTGQTNPNLNNPYPDAYSISNRTETPEVPGQNGGTSTLDETLMVPLKVGKNKMTINVFVYDTNGDYIKIPMILNFVIN